MGENHYAYEDAVPGRREPTQQESERMVLLTLTHLRAFGIDHLLRFYEAIAAVTAAADRDEGELHVDCLGKMGQDGKPVAFVYIGTEHMDTMALRPDTQDHFARLNEAHAEAKRAHEAKHPRAN